jgi:hypothetical protein
MTLKFYSREKTRNQLTAIPVTTTAAAATPTTATISTAAATAAITTAAAAGRTLLTRPGFVNRQGTALKFLAVKLGDRRVRFGL